MKKSVKMMLALALVVIMGVASQESYLADVRQFQIMKTQGKTGVTTNVYMPFYEEAITYKLKSLSGTCSYVAAKCVTDPKAENVYRINNSMRGYLYTKPDQATFKLWYHWYELQFRPQVTFVMSIEHNSTNLKNDTLTSTGSISY